MNNHAQQLIDRAEKNVAKWGEQDLETLALAMSEENGELSQAFLQVRHEGGDPDRIRQEAIDCGALALQILRHFPEPKRVLYVDPQQHDILCAFVEGGIVKFISRARSWDDVHNKIAHHAVMNKSVDEVRIDTGFRTGEAREMVSRFGWIEDRNFDVRKMMAGAGINPEPPVKRVSYRPTALEYKPAHGGRPEHHAPHTHTMRDVNRVPVEASHDFLNTAPVR